MITSHSVEPSAGRRTRLRGGLVGAGAAACAVCCAAPLMALVGIGVSRRGRDRADSRLHRDRVRRRGRRGHRRGGRRPPSEGAGGRVRHRGAWFRAR